MKQDDFLKQITSKLDGAARQHKDKAVVMSQVIEKIHHQGLPINHALCTVFSDSRGRFRAICRPAEFS